MSVKFWEIGVKVGGGFHFVREKVTVKINSGSDEDIQEVISFLTGEGYKVDFIDQR